jgi:AraC family transcriptional regulator of arabinose operon
MYGTCKALVDQKLTVIEPGDLLMYQPGDPYELQIGKKGHAESGDYFLLCEGAWIEAWWKQTARKTKLRIRLSSGIVSLWQQLCAEQHRLEPNTLLIQHLLCALCLSIDQISVESDTTQRFSNKSVMLCKEMKHYIEEHAFEAIRVEDISKDVGLSESRASHLFKDYFGYTMIQYVQEVRLRNGLNLIQFTDYTLEYISEICGFNNYSYFHKVFKEKFDLTPGAVRQSPERYELSNRLNNQAVYEKSNSGTSSEAKAYFKSSQALDSPQLDSSHP